VKRKWIISTFISLAFVVVVDMIVIPHEISLFYLRNTNRTAGSEKRKRIGCLGRPDGVAPASYVAGFDVDTDANGGGEG